MNNEILYIYTYVPICVTYKIYIYIYYIDKKSGKGYA